MPGDICHPSVSPSLRMWVMNLQMVLGYDRAFPLSIIYPFPEPLDQRPQRQMRK